MSTHISQAEARRLRKRVRAMEDERERLLAHWLTDYPGVYVGSVVCHDGMHEPSMIATARKLGRVVIAMADGQKIKLFAVAVEP